MSIIQIRLAERVHFALGVLLESGYGFVIALGWVSFEIVWNPIDIALSKLPQFEPGNCTNCGAGNYTSFNLNSDKKVVDCNLCKGYPGGPQ